MNTTGKAKALPRIKTAVDILMTAALLFLMPYMLMGEEAHEWIGLSTFLLFIIHHLLNIGFWKRLFRGRYAPARILMTVVDILVLLSMLGLMVSSVIISRYVLDFLSIHGAAAFGRTLHMLCAYWGFVFMSVHLGLHWGVIIGRVKNTPGRREYLPALKWIARIAGFAVAVWGAVSFIRYDLLQYMFLRCHFVFFDFEEPVILFILNYAAIMGLWIWIAHYAQLGIKKLRKKRK